jgi:hypothetical protein
MTDPTDEYTEPPEDVLRELDRSVTLTVTSAQAIGQTLRHVDEFLRCYASPAVRAELRAFCAAQGWSPICGADAFLDSIGFHALALRWAIDAATTDHAGDSAGADQNKETA